MEIHQDVFAVHWVSFKSMPKKDMVAIEKWGELHGGVTGVVKEAPLKGGTAEFPFRLSPPAPAPAPAPTFARKVGWDASKVSPVFFGYDGGQSGMPQRQPQPQQPQQPQRTVKGGSSAFPFQLPVHALQEDDDTTSTSSTSTAPAPAPAPVVARGGGAKRSRSRSRSRSRGRASAVQTARRAKSPSPHSPPRSRSRSPRARAAAAKGKRQFWHTDERGVRMPSSPVYVLDSTDDAQNTPIDVVRQIVQSMLHLTRKKNTDVELLPASVEKAVEQAVRQNFMCMCPRGATNCTDQAACRRRSRAQGDAYLKKYMRDAPRVFTDSIAIYLREPNKPSMREYVGGYRLINNPSKHCIRNNINKEVVAKYVQSHRLHD